VRKTVDYNYSDISVRYICKLYFRIMMHLYKLLTMILDTLYSWRMKYF